MNPAVATVIVAAIVAVSGIIGAALSAWLSKDRDEADITAKITDASEKVLERMDREVSRLDAKCSKCETDLIDARARMEDAIREAHAARTETRQSNAVLRRLVRALDDDDPAARAEAIASARELV